MEGSAGSAANDVRCLRALRALRDLELDGLSLGERLEAVAGDGGEVNEDVVP